MNRRIITILCALSLGTALWAVPDVDHQWKAQWISKEQSLNIVNTWIAFRKTVTIDEVPQSVTTRIAADSKYWLWINGELVVFEGGLKRGPAPGDGYYDKLDIAPYLRKGENLISVLIWHFGKGGFSHMSSGIAALLFEAIGPGVEILSDQSWEASVHHAYQVASGEPTNCRLPESNVRFDARSYPYDWFKGGRPKFLGSALELGGVAPGMPPLGRLVERPFPLWKFSPLREYEKVETKGDTLVCTLPYNCHMTPYLKVEAAEGKLIKLETDHSIVTGNQCLRGEYVTRKGTQEYEHLAWMNGEKMYYILPQGVKVLDVKYRESSFNTEFSGSFHCNDELLNEYWQKAQRTLLVCMRDTYYDCPDRERAQWWGDEVNELGEAFYALSPSSQGLALKGIHELVNWQKADGSLYSPIPCSNYFKELPIQILASVGWYGFHNFWFYSGNDSFIAPVYDRVHKYLHETWKLDETGLPIYREGQWDWPDAGHENDKMALLPNWYYLALKAENVFAEKLGKTSDIELNKALMAQMEKSYNQIYWNGSAYRTADYKGKTDDRVQAMAVLSGLADATKYDAILKVLANEAHATTYMFKYVLEALIKMGHPELAIERMHRFYPTIMKDDCSTLWEHWNHSGTCNHAWAGSGIMVMSGMFAGIQPVEPGFKVFRVAPQMAGLTEIDCKMETTYGMIEVSLRRKGKKIDMTLAVPEGSTAIVPTGKGKEVTLTAGIHTVKITI